MDKVKLFGKYLAAAVVVAAGPQIVEAAIKALTESGLAGTTFGSLAAAGLGALLLYLKSPKQGK